jgi:hypothetical protein
MTATLSEKGEGQGQRIVPAVDPALVERAVLRGSRRYVESRRGRIPAFIAKNFSVSGAAELHGRAVGWDLLRAPANLGLSLPYVALQGTAAVSRGLGMPRAGDWLGRKTLLLTTDVAREIEWRLFSEFLELPYRQTYRGQERTFEGDALADTILSDPELSRILRAMLARLGRRAEDPEFRQWLSEAMTAYTGSRVAAGDLANALLSAGAGALLAKQWTPGALSLGPAIANLMAHQAAVASFPLGAGLGSLWYGAFPVSASAAATVTLTGGVLAGFALLSAFSGMATDPIQKRLGLHERRLNKLLDGLDHSLIEGRGEFRPRDHYAARVFDLFDMVSAAYRVTLR